MAKNTVLTINGAVYSFDANGVSTLDAADYAMGRAIAAYAQKFIGYPYAYGGATDLTKGVDCSGFTKLVFQHFGINIPRTSQAQALGNKSQEAGGPFAEVKYISERELLPGDIIGYYYTAPTHVAIYIGNGKVVHASNSQPRKGASRSPTMTWGIRTTSQELCVTGKNQGKRLLVHRFPFFMPSADACIPLSRQTEPLPPAAQRQKPSRPF